MKKTFIAFLLLVGLLSAVPATSHAQPLVVTVDGVNVNLDWSAMPAATSYILYYALTDYKGDIDIDTIGSIEMGGNKSLYVPGLPSGLIIFVAILAHTDQGDVVSNIEEFMGFAGTVTFPETGNVIIKVDDPGGIGNYSVSGVRDTNGTATAITEIAYTGQTESFVMEIRDDKPYTITQDNVTTRFIYQADGSIAFETVQANMAQSLSVLASLSTGTGSSICDQYADKDTYEKALRMLPLSTNDLIGSTVLHRLEGYPRTFIGLITDPPKLENHIFFHMTILARHYGVSSVIDEKLDLIFDYWKIVLESAMAIINEEVEKKLAEYDQLCSGQIRLPDMGDISCPIPDGAELRRYDHDTVYYLNGHRVGPQESWMRDNNTDYYLVSRSCYNTAGQANGWNIAYRENGMMDYANHWKNGQLDGSDYRFYDNGSLHVETTSRNDSPIHRIIYHEDGTIKAECDYSEEEGWLGPCGWQYW